MRKLLNVLYVNTPESYLSLDGENVVVLIQNKESFRVPAHNLENIVCFGFMGASPALMGFCAEKGIGLCFINPYGNFLASISGPVKGNVLLRKKQYKISEEDQHSLSISRNIILGKLNNCRAVIERGIRDHEDKVDATLLKDVSTHIKEGIENVRRANSLEKIRGVEGDCARAYFSAINELILCQKEYFYMKERSKRPPKDNFNALLSFLYTLLAQEVQNALESVGLDPYVGFFHTDRPGRASLAMDIMEEFRAFLVDRLALSLINRRQISEKGFVTKESGGVLMEYDTRKEVLTAWQKRKQETITHPFLGDKIEAGLLPYVQALLLARYLRGDIEEYPPFLWK